MVDGNVSRSSYVIALFFLGILYNTGRLIFEDRFCFATAADLEFGTYQPGQEPTAYLVFVPAWNNSHHDSKVYNVKGYLSSRVSRYPNSASTFQISRLIISGDIAENPGPSTNKLICPECSRTIAKNHRTLTCSVCDLTYHIKCGNATPKDFKLIQRIVPMTWKCPICLDDISFDLNELPFASLSEEPFISMVRTDPLYNESSQCNSDNDHLGEIAQKINTSPNDSSDESDLSPTDWFASNINSYYKRNLKIDHFNVNSIYGKADEVIDLLDTCRLDIFFVAERKIDGSVNSSLFAPSEHRIIRRDRKKGGSGVLVYIRRSITALRRARLEPDGVESICLDVKGFGNSWFVICACYRSPGKCKISDFLSSCVLAAEKMYTKRKEVMFLGDFDIDMLTENE